MKSIHPLISRGFLFLLLHSATWAAPFVPPTEENPPFRREKLPIDSDSMGALSRGLTLLSQSQPLESAEQRRAAAQSLALALALDPANTAARDNLAALSEGKSLPSPKPETLTRAKAQIWQLHGWLATAESGANGNLLADCIGDAATALDPAHPSAIALRKSPERGKWDGWIAPVAEFEEKAVAEIESTEPIAKIQPDMPTPPADGTVGIQLSQATLSTVLYQYDEKDGFWTLQNTPIKMKSAKTTKAIGESEDSEDEQEREREENEAESFAIEIPSTLGEEADVSRFVAEPILAALSALHGSLPETGSIYLLTGQSRTYQFAKNSASLTGPGFILADAALTGIEPEAIVLAELDETHQLVTPDYFLQILRVLADGPGGRLVVPASAEPYFTSLLALEMPEFFLKYEVLSASTLEEFIARCAKAPSETQAASSASFSEIRDKAAGNPTGIYLANHFVRQRLLEITEDAPYHLSAKLLAMQGAGERPRTLSKKMLAAEIWRAVDPIHAAAGINLADMKPKTLVQLKALYDQCRTDVDGLDRYTDIRDRDLLSKGIDLTTALRTLTREIESRDEQIPKYKAIIAAHTALVAADTGLRLELSELTGDPLPQEKTPLNQRRLDPEDTE